MIALREKGLSYQAIGSVFGLSRARVHQLISGYSRLLNSIADNGWYEKIRQAIFERDGSICSKCGKPNNLLIHHIDGDDKNSNLTNLITLCNKCHLDLHRPNSNLGEEFMEGKEILKLRKKLGLTQKELAARLKVDAITVSRWERCEQRPSRQGLKQLDRLKRNNQATKG